MVASAAPIVTRDALVAGRRVHHPRGAGAAPVRVGVTGTGEQLLLLAWSADDLARERAAGARLFGRLGITAGMRVANGLPGALATPGALLLGDVVEEIGALDVPLGEIGGDAAARAAWELVDRVEPDVLVLDAPGGLTLLAAAPARARTWWRGIVWLRGAVSPPRPPIPPVAGFGGWQRDWLAVPEATCFVGHSCARGVLHVDDEVTAEVVDPATGAPLPPGRPGEIALASRRAGERFASGIRGRALAGPCACGEAGIALETA
jgi:hypothetical protein